MLLVYLQRLLFEKGRAEAKCVDLEKELEGSVQHSTRIQTSYTRYSYYYTLSSPLSYSRALSSVIYHFSSLLLYLLSSLFSLTLSLSFLLPSLSLSLFSPLLLQDEAGHVEEEREDTGIGGERSQGH